MNIFYKYSNCDKIQPTKGDFINETGIISAMLDGNNVWYNHQAINTRNGGNSYGASVNQTYDIAYIRANRNDFLYVRAKKKIWMASPYDKECYSKADAISCFSQTWTDCLKKGIALPGLNPAGTRYCKAMYFPQVVGSHFMPKDNRDRNIFTIGYFGRMNNNCYPYLLFEALKHLNIKYRILFSFTSGSINNPNITYLPKTSYFEMPEMYALCDCIIESYHGSSWDFTGSLKEKEACVMGIPIILSKSPARDETFGSDYPLYMKSGVMGTTDKQQAMRLAAKIESLTNEKFRTEISDSLKIKGNQYTVKEASKLINKNLQSL